jgi:hypothetical protein
VDSSSEDVIEDTAELASSNNVFVFPASLIGGVAVDLFVGKASISNVVILDIGELVS